MENRLDELDQLDPYLAEVTIHHELDVAVRELYGVSLGDLMVMNRKYMLNDIRHAAMRVLSDKYYIKTPYIAEFFGRDRTSVIYAIKEARSVREKNEIYHEIIWQIEKNLVSCE